MDGGHCVGHKGCEEASCSWLGRDKEPVTWQPVHWQTLPLLPLLERNSDTSSRSMLVVVTP